MSQRWTKADIDAFRRQWLLARMGHTWGLGAPTRCRLCGAKCSPANSRRFCPKRHKPNRWRLHYRRALMQAQYPPTEPIVRDAAWILGQLDQIRREVNRDPRFAQDLRYWKYHRLARRHRRLLREWWQLPMLDVRPFLLQRPEGGDARVTADLTRRQNKLLKQVQATQQLIVQDGGCTYTFNVDATWNGRPLFTEEA